jgi:hypothetical protein
MPAETLIARVIAVVTDEDVKYHACEQLAIVVAFIDLSDRAVRPLGF